MFHHSNPHSSTHMSQQTGTLFIEQADHLDVGVWTEDGPVGTTYEVQLELSGPLDHMGFVCDFSITKQLIKDALKTKIDHRFIAPTRHSHYVLTLKDGRAIWKSEVDQTYFYEGPADSVYPINASKITTDILTAEIKAILTQAFQAYNLHMHVKLCQQSPAANDVTHIRYTHGASAHQGQCHRMWHGHHSQVMVLRNNQRSPELERYLYEQILGGSGFHLAQPDHILSSHSQWSPQSLGPLEQDCTLKYESKAGTYHAIMPASKVFLMNQHTSVEALSWSLALRLKVADPLATIHVRLYEGLNKGGVCELP